MMYSLALIISLSLGFARPNTDLAFPWHRGPSKIPRGPGNNPRGPGNNPGRTQGDLSWLQEAYTSGNVTLFNEYLTPFLLMSTIQYFDTNDMNDPEEASKLMGHLKDYGFDRVTALTADPPLGTPGVKVQVFQNTDLKVSVFAYRGTNMSNPADLCADNYLGFGNSDAFDCSVYTDAQVDYYAQGLKFLRTTAPKIPKDHQIMITGHSLGAGLGALIGMTSNLSTVVFSSPPFGGFANKTGLSWETADPNKLAIFADQWDPVYNMASDNSFRANGWTPGTITPTLAQDRSGTECVWYSNVTTSCLALFGYGQEYDNCFKEKHYIWNYFDHLKGDYLPACTLLSKSA